MTKAEASVIIDRPTEVVWSFMVSDVDKFAKATNPDVIESKKTSAGPIGVGTTFREMRSKTPKVMDYRVTEYEPSYRFAIEMTSGPIKGSVATEKVENIEGKTKFTETADYHMSGFYKLFQPFFAGKAQKETEDRVGRVKRAVESEAKS
jgi:ligand-binding SRPBCC domain-containing protein